MKRLLVILILCILSGILFTNCVQEYCRVRDLKSEHIITTPYPKEGCKVGDTVALTYACGVYGFNGWKIFETKLGLVDTAFVETFFASDEDSVLLTVFLKVGVVEGVFFQ